MKEQEYLREAKTAISMFSLEIKEQILVDEIIIYRDNWDTLIPFYSKVIKFSENQPFYFSLQFWFNKVEICIRNNDKAGAFENIITALKKYSEFIYNPTNKK